MTVLPHLALTDSWQSKELHVVIPPATLTSSVLPFSSHRYKQAMYLLTIKFAFSPTKKRGTPPQIALTRHTSLSIYSFSIYQYSFVPAGMWLSTMRRCSSLSSLSFRLLTAESNMPQGSMPIMGRGGRFVIAISVFPISSSGS